MRYTRVASVLACVTSLTVVVGCGSKDSSSTASSSAGSSSTAQSASTTAAPAASKSCRIGLSFGATGTSSYITELSFIKEQAKARNCTVVIGNAAGDPTKQFNEVQQWIQTKKVDAITMLPIGGAVEPLMKQAAAAGIPVVGWGGDFPGTKAGIPKDQKLAGTQLAAAAVAWAKQKFKGRLGDFSYGIFTYDQCGAPCKDRTDTVKRILKKELGVNPAVTGEAVTSDAGLTKAENMLQARPKLAMILSINDAGALGAVKAVEEAGRAKDMFVGGMDGDPEALQAIAKGGAFKATAAFRLGDLANAVINVPADILQKDGPPTIVPQKPVLVASPSAAQELLAQYKGA